jgi:hypothetical protein
MADLPVKEKKIYSYGEAVAMLPQVQQITATAHARVEELRPRAEGGARDAQQAIDEILGDWARQILALGIEVKGLWLVDFDSGSGYYCWKHPEPGLRFFHSYEDGFSGRVPIQ